MTANKLIWNQNEKSIDVAFKNDLRVGSRIGQARLVAEHAELLQNSYVMPTKLQALIDQLIDQAASYELIADIMVLCVIGQSTQWQDGQLSIQHRNSSGNIFVSAAGPSRLFIENPLCTADARMFVELCPMLEKVKGYWQVKPAFIDITHLEQTTSCNNIYDNAHFSPAEQMLIDAALTSNIDAAFQLAWHMKTISMIRLIKKFTANPASGIGCDEFAQNCHQLKSVLMAIASKHQR